MNAFAPCLVCATDDHDEYVDNLQDAFAVCPTCGSVNTVPISYGMSTPSDDRRLGGCEIPLGCAPQWHCNACREEFVDGAPLSFYDGPATDVGRSLAHLWNTAFDSVLATNTEVPARIALLGIEPPGVPDRWWWQATSVSSVCSNHCWDQALRDGAPALARFELDRSWYRVWGRDFSQPQTRRWFGGPSAPESIVEPAGPAFAHLTAPNDPVGVMAIYDKGNVNIIESDDEAAPLLKDLALDALEQWGLSVTRTKKTPKRTAKAASPDPAQPAPGLVTRHCVIEIDLGDDWFDFDAIPYATTQPEPATTRATIRLPRWILRELNQTHLDVFAGHVATAASLAAAGHIQTLRGYVLDLDTHRIRLQQRAETLGERLLTEPAAMTTAPRGGFVYGSTPWGALFLDRSWAEDYADTWEAIQHTYSLEHLESVLPPRLRDWVLEEAREQLEWTSDDDDPFRNALTRFDEPDGGPWPWLNSDHHWNKGLDLLPQSALPPEDEAEFESTGDGDYIVFDDPDAVAEAVRAAGRNCARDDQLVRLAIGPYC